MKKVWFIIWFLFLISCTDNGTDTAVPNSAFYSSSSILTSVGGFVTSSSSHGVTYLKDTIWVSGSSIGNPGGVSSSSATIGDTSLQSSSSFNQQESGAFFSSAIDISALSSSIHDVFISSSSISISSFQSLSSSFEQSSSLPIESSSKGGLSSSEHASCQSAPSSSSFPSSSSVSSSSAAPAPPEAHNVCITGIHSVGSVLRGTYTYSDVNRDLEGNSQYQWYRNDTALIGETDTTHTLQSEDLGNIFSFSVIPSAQIGTPTTGIKSIVYDTIYFENHAEANALLDSRDGEEYDIVYIGLQIWMAQNLRYMVDSVSHRGDGSEDTGSAGRYYYVLGYDPVGSTHAEQLDSAKKTENYKRYGVLYNLYAAEERDVAYRGNFNPSGFRGACPEFWHLPSDKEWEELAVFVGSKTIGAVSDQYGDWYEIGKELKAISTLWDGNKSHTDAFKFNALPSSTREDIQSIPDPLYGKYARWWSSTLLYQRWIANDLDVFFRGFINKDEDAGLSVRCVKD